MAKAAPKPKSGATARLAKPRCGQGCGKRKVMGLGLNCSLDNFTARWVWNDLDRLSENAADGSTWLVPI